MTGDLLATILFFTGFVLFYAGAMALDDFWFIALFALYACAVAAWCVKKTDRNDETGGPLMMRSHPGARFVTAETIMKRNPAFLFLIPFPASCSVQSAAVRETAAEDFTATAFVWPTERVASETPSLTPSGTPTATPEDTAAPENTATPELDRSGSILVRMFDGHSSYQLYGVGVDGGRDPRKMSGDIYLTNCTGSVRVSPDGKTIAFSMYSRQTDAYGYPAGESLNIINLDGSGLRELVPVESSFDNYACSPDGTRIAYGNWPDDKYGIFLVDRWGSIRRHTASDSNEFVINWISNGEILYSVVLAYHKVDLMCATINSYIGTPTKM
jgi:hypothetical protein